MSSLVAAAREALARSGDPAAAVEMQRYMKSTMPFHGVPKPARQRLLRELLAEHPIAGPEELRADVEKLWDGAGHREERYLALSLTGHRPYARWLDPGWVPLFRAWIVEGGWWDFTDEIASRLIGPLLRAHPEVLTPVMRAWAVEPDRWLRRTAVICQLGSKQAIDLALLTTAIEANLDDRDFFLRKGIGWALRQHSRVEAAWVRAFVDEHPGLSALSQKEALRLL